MELSKEKTRSSLQGYTAGVAIKSDKKYIVYGSEVTTLTIWNFQAKIQESVLGYNGRFMSIAITSDNNYIASLSIDTTLRIWNLQEKRQEAVLVGHTNVV